MTTDQPRSRFPTTFWVANGMELFEQAADFGLDSVLAVYLTRSVAEDGLGGRMRSSPAWRCRPSSSWPWDSEV